jgi:hypothetical protein
MGRTVAGIEEARVAVRQGCDHVWSRIDRERRIDDINNAMYYVDEVQVFQDETKMD